MPATAETKVTYVLPGKGGDIDRVKIGFHQGIARRFGDRRRVHNVHWQRPELGTLDQRLEGFLTVVRGDLEEGREVRLIGTSGGGSFAVNALFAEPRISRVATVSMRANTTDFPGYTSFAELSKEVPLMGESIQKMADQVKDIPAEVRSRVLTVITRGDPVVATRAAFLDGAMVYVPSYAVNDHGVGVWEAFQEPTVTVIADFLNTGTLPAHTTC